VGAGRRLIACSRMYNLTPEIAAAWARLFAWVAERSGVALDIVDHPAPAPLEDLWARGDMGCVFMCGWPYAMAAPRPLLLVAPVPFPARYGGRPVYFTDLIVRRDSPYRTLADTFGGRVAWTVEHSHSGFNAPRHHLLPHLGPGRTSLYAASVGPLVSPVRVLQAILDGDADVGPLDSMALDLWRAHAPERVASIRVLDTTAAATRGGQGAAAVGRPGNGKPVARGAARGARRAGTGGRPADIVVAALRRGRSRRLRGAQPPGRSSGCRGLSRAGVRRMR